MLTEGGRFELQDAIDFEGSIGSAEALFRKVLIDRMGKWSLSRDAKNGVINVDITPAVEHR